MKFTFELDDDLPHGEICADLRSTANSYHDIEIKIEKVDENPNFNRVTLINSTQVLFVEREPKTSFEFFQGAVTGIQQAHYLGRIFVDNRGDFVKMFPTLEIAYDQAKTIRV